MKLRDKLSLVFDHVDIEDPILLPGVTLDDEVDDLIIKGDTHFYWGKKRVFFYDLTNIRLQQGYMLDFLITNIICERRFITEVSQCNTYKEVIYIVEGQFNIAKMTGIRKNEFLEIVKHVFENSSLKYKEFELF